MNIFFDLDGTLLDSKQRLYQLFQHLVPNSNLSFDSYWAFKQNKINHQQILTEHLNYSSTQFADFEASWMSKIELPIWLALDLPFSGVVSFLSALHTNFQLFVVTARQSQESANHQLEIHQLGHFFIDILVTKQKKEKWELIEPLKPTVNDWIVGDTGYDILTGKKLGLKTAAVLSGFMSKSALSKYNPDIIVEKVIDLKF